MASFDPNFFFNLWNSLGVLPFSTAEHVVHVTDPKKQKSASAAPVASASSFGDNTSQTLDDYLPYQFDVQTASSSPPASSGEDVDSQINAFVDSIFQRGNADGQTLVSNSGSGGSGSSGGSGNAGDSPDSGDNSFGWPQIGQGLATLGGALLGAAPDAISGYFDAQAKYPSKKPFSAPFEYKPVPWHPTNFQTYASNHRPITSGSLAGLDYSRNKRS